MWNHRWQGTWSCIKSEGFLLKWAKFLTKTEFENEMHQWALQKFQESNWSLIKERIFIRCIAGTLCLVQNVQWQLLIWLNAILFIHPTLFLKYSTRNYTAGFSTFLNKGWNNCLYHSLNIDLSSSSFSDLATFLPNTWTKTLMVNWWRPLIINVVRDWPDSG